ncbi:hypothetical protein [Rubrivirga sp.]|uniref:hypothetical protein n=1 Tax=Rubrivirga sp. TaxID=1885344 RepID=UPI003C787E03
MSSVFLAGLLSGCDSAQTTSGDDVVPQTAVEVRAFYRANLAAVDSYAAERDLPVESPEVILAGTRQFYADQFGPSSDEYSLYASALESQPTTGARLAANSGDEVPEAVADVAQDVESLINGSDTFVAFMDGLADLYTQTEGSDLSSSDREMALAYIAVVQESMAYLDQQNGYSDAAAMEYARIRGWRCAAGILGSAALGGLGGFGAAGPIGATIGAIGGGLVGTAEFC